MIETEKMSSHPLRDAAERFTREGRTETRQNIQQAAEAAYEEAGTWLQENYGKAIAVVGVLALAGVAGYIMGRNSLSTGVDIRHS